MLKMGILGFGGIGRLHAPNIIAHPDVELTAVCGRRPINFDEDIKTNLDDPNAGGDYKEKLKKAVPYTDFQAMLDEKNLDALLIALPNYMHTDYTVKALDAGVNVLLEKPMAITVEDCNKILVAAERSGKVLMVGHCLRFSSNWKVVHDKLEGGEFGKLRSLECRRESAWPDWCEWLMKEDLSGGCILDMHIHDIDFALWMAGNPKKIQATGQYNKEKGGWAIVRSQWLYDEDLVVTLHGQWHNRPGFRHSCVAHFEKGVMESIGDEVHSFEVGKDEDMQPVALDNVSGHQGELNYFLECVRENKKPEFCPPQDAAEAIRLAYLEKKSLETGEPVLVD